MSDLFISYARKDKEFVRKIVTALEAEGFDVWIDLDDLPKGEDWEKEIYQNIDEAEAFLFMLSPDSVVSEMCNREITHAVENGKRILPIVIRDADKMKFISEIAKEEIAKRNWIFCREGQDDFNQAMEETRKTVHTDYEWLKYHTELQVKALKWEQKKDASRLLRGKELRETEEKLAKTGNQKDPQPTELHRSYVLASQRNEVYQRRQITTSLGIGLAVVAALAVFAWVQRNIAQAEKEHAEEQARIALARQLAVQSQSLSDSSPILSLLLGVESVQATTDFGDPVVPESYQQILNRLGSLGGTPLVGHSAGITSIAFSPACSGDKDQCWLVTGSKDGTIRLWGFEGHESGVSSVLIETNHGEVTLLDISPDGQWLASSGSDGTVSLWDLKATNPGSSSIDLKGHEYPVQLVAFNPLGDQLITSDAMDTKMWDLKPEVSTEPRILLHDPVMTLAFSRDGHWLAAGGIGFVVYLWDLWSKDPTAAQQELSVGETIYALDFSDDGNWLAAGSEDNLARVWAFSANGPEITPSVLEGHIWPVKTLGFVPNDVLLTGSSDGDIRVWPMGLGYATNSSVVRGSPGLSEIKIGPDGNVIAITAGNTLTLWPEMWYSYPQTSSSHEGRINALAFSSDTKWVATGSEDGVARIYSIRDGLAANPRKISQSDLSKLPLSTSSSLDSVRDVSYSDLLSSYPLLDLSPMLDNNDQYSFAVSPSERWLLICAWSGKCGLWDMLAANPYTVAKVFKGHASGIASVAFSADEQWLVTSGLYDRTIMISNLADLDLVSQPVVLFPGQPMLIEYFEPDEGILIAQGVEHERESWVWQLKWENLIVLACKITGRNMTRTEWVQYIPDKPYRLTCPQWPAGE